MLQLAVVDINKVSNFVCVLCTLWSAICFAAFKMIVVLERLCMFLHNDIAGIEGDLLRIARIGSFVSLTLEMRYHYCVVWS